MGRPELENARSDCNTRITHINPLQTRLGVAQMQHTCNELIQGQKTHSLRPNIWFLPNVVVPILNSSVSEYFVLQINSGNCVRIRICTCSSAI